jgi:hypothetical protein
VDRFRTRGKKETRVVQKVVDKAIADIQAGSRVVCTLEEYYSTVRMALQRYALDQAALGRPDLVARVTAELRRLDAARAGWWLRRLSLGLGVPFVLFADAMPCAR